MAELYTNAAKIVEKILKKQGSPKSLVINDDNVRNKKKLYALVCEALKYKSVTEQIMEDTKLLSTEKQLRHPLALVLLYDFLFGKGLQMGGKLKQIISRNKTSLNASLAKMKVRAKVMRNEDLLPVNIRDQEENQTPRYVRVNTLKTSTSDVVSWFCSNGYKVSDTGTVNSLTQVQSQAPNCFEVDSHIPEILVFPPGTDFHDHPLYREGKIILQDKASCFPAFVLNPPPGSCVIDACAAPGNKTSHLAAIMKNIGEIYAFDIAPKRIEIMKKLLDCVGEFIVEVKNEDFLKVNLQDSAYSNVEYILVDPSCSGSGMVNRLDYATSNGEKMDSKEEQRIESLSQFQVTALSHALSFPAVKKVVYSTCSFHDKENEGVVKTVLERFSEKFELGNALPTWQHRGRPLFAKATKCVRASPREGKTSGFFLALFQRKGMKEAEKEDGVKVERNEEKKKRKKKRRKRKLSENTIINNDELGKKEEDGVKVDINGEEKKRKKKRRKRKRSENTITNNDLAKKQKTVDEETKIIKTTRKTNNRKRKRNKSKLNQQET